ncbi:MAG: CBS domain-containing protein [Candidatus Hadarchaeales archaeon]
MPVTVEDFMTRKVVKIDASRTIAEAARLMAEEKVGSIIVFQEDRPVGIVTDRDIVVRAVARGLSMDEKVEKIMSQPLITVESKTPIIEAIQLMDKHMIRRLPVVEEGKIVGILTSTDIGRASKILAPFLLPRIPEIYLIPLKEGSKPD